MFNNIKKDLISAMKEQDKFKLSVLRMLKSALTEAEINKKAPELLKEYSAYGDVYTVEDYLEEENKEMRGR